MVVHHSAQPPTNEEWDVYVRLLEQAMATHGSVKILVDTDGRPPTATQRAALTKVLGNRTTPTAILTRSAAIRTVLTAFRWWNPTMDAFSPDDLPKAMEFLQLAPGMRREIERTLAELRLEVAQSLPRVPVP
jgi:hypothetical protein